MRIEEITKQRLVSASDLELKQLKYKATQFWDRHFKNNKKEIVGCFERGNFIAKYRLLLDELSSPNRTLEKSTCDLDRQAFKQKMEVKQAGIDITQLVPITTGSNYIVLDENFVQSPELRITIKSSSEPDTLLEEEIKKMFGDQFDKPCVFAYERDFEGSCIPLFHEVLEPINKLEKIEVKTNQAEIEKDIDIIPVEKGDEHIVYGIVYEPDTVDAQNDMASADAIKKAAYDFMENVQTFKVMHKGKKVKTKILENYIAPVDFKIGKREIKKGAWILVTRVLDKQLWKDIKSGDINGYSMAGYAKVED